MAKTKLKAVEAPLKLDIGCGKNKKEGFHGVDKIAFEGVDTVIDLAGKTPQFANSADPFKPHGGEFKKWPWPDESVEEVHCSHFVEHLTASERIHFVNELYRVLKPGAKALLITPHWASNRSYGDLTHQWPPVSEMWFYYLSKDWRAINAPHNDFYTCDFEATWGYGLLQDVAVRNQQYQMHALTFWKEAAQDTIATLTKRAKNSNG